MGYTDEKRDVSQLIEIGANGISVPTFVQIRDALIQEYKLIYGSDIDIDPNPNVTADAQFVHDEANMINNIMLALNKLQSQMNANTATGTMLDTICAFSGVLRQQATSSYANMYVKYIGADIPGGFVATQGSGDGNTQKIVLVDKNGKTWTWSESKFDGADFNTKFVRYNDDGKDLIYHLTFTCDVTGPIAAEAVESFDFDEDGDPILTADNHGFIYKTIDSILYPFEVWQEFDAIIGTDTESDQSLRARRLESRSDNGISTLSGLKGALESLAGVEEVKIYNNNSDGSGDFRAKDGTLIDRHDVYICVRYSDQNIFNTDSINSLDEPIGTCIYNKLTPGIYTAITQNNQKVIRRNYKYSLSDSIAAANVNWKMCYPVSFYNITLNFVQYDSYDSKICEPEITKNCKEFARSLSISEDFSIFNLIAYINSNITFINNRQPYYCLSGSINAQDVIDGTVLSNSDNYFNLNKILQLAAEQADWVPVLLKTAEEKTEKANSNYPTMVCYNQSIHSSESGINVKLLYEKDVRITWHGPERTTVESAMAALIPETAVGFDNGQIITDDIDGKIIYYTGPEISDRVEVRITTPGGGDTVDANLYLYPNRYYRMYKDSVGGYNKYVGIYQAQEVYPIQASFTTLVSGVNPKLATSYSAIIADNTLIWSMVDVENDNKYLYQSKHNTPTPSDSSNLEYVPVKYTFTSSENNTMILTLVPTKE